MERPFIEILECGYATIQDLGRVGYRCVGVPASGAMDRLSAVYANALVGNSPSEAVIEVVGGPIALRPSVDTVIAVVGARVRVSVDGVPAEEYRPIYLRRGSVLRVSAPLRGLVTYIAVAGGIDVPRVLGSRSTYVRGGFGGLEGRALRPGDRVPIASIDASRVWSHVCTYRAPSTLVYRLPVSTVILRATRGIHADLLGASLETLLRSVYTVAPDSDRMGFRLSGPVPEKAQELGRIISVAVDRGCVQVPPEGGPIVLMADAQTTGGYAVALHLPPPEVDRLAQCPPGTQVRFVLIDESEAEEMTARYLDELEEPRLEEVDEELYDYFV